MRRSLFWGLSIILSFAPLLRAQPGGFAATGNLHQARYSHTATRLANGRVLVTGGVGSSGQSLKSAEIYNPLNGIWTRVADMKFSRAGHTATLLIGGRVLVAGGQAGSELRSQAEIYDPHDNEWTQVDGLSSARVFHTATRLLDGKVLVVGGVGESGTGAMAEVESFNPAAHSWESRAPLEEARENHFATLMGNGEVLVAGGNSAVFLGQFIRLASSELYNPAQDEWSSAGEMSEARVDFQGLRLADDRVLVAGGDTASSEVFDPARGFWTGSSDMREPRTGFSLSQLADGRVLAAGGTLSAAPLDSADLLSPTPGFWYPTSPMLNQRAHHTATSLLDGRVLVAGGKKDGQAIRAAELYTAGTDAPASRLLFAQLVIGGGFSSVLLLSNSSATNWSGRVLLSGGNWGSSIPWTVNSQDRTGESEIAVNLGPSATVQFLMQSSQGPFSGWFEIEGNPGSSVASIASGFYYRVEESGRLIAATGLVPATAARSVRFPVRKDLYANTGMAIREGHNLSLSLFDSQGMLVDSVLLSNGRALFFDELFDDISNNFLGSVEVSAGVGFFITVLRQEFDRDDPGRFQITSIQATPVPEN